MNIVITGGTGYLGSRLTHRFLKLGHRVLCLRVPGDPCVNLADVWDDVLFVETSDERLEEIFTCFHPEVIVHTATVYERGNATLEQVFEANLLFPFQILQLAIKCEAKRWINTATGLPDMVNSYSLAKAQFGQWGYLLAKRKAIEFINLRLEHFYGENGPDTHFLSWVIKKLKKNEAIDLTEGTQHRDFIYVEDVVDCFVHMLTASDSDYMEICIGTGVAPTIREVVEYLQDLCGSTSELRFGAVPMRENEPDCVCDISVMKRLGMSPQYSWQEGLRKLL